MDRHTGHTGRNRLAALLVLVACAGGRDIAAGAGRADDARRARLVSFVCDGDFRFLTRLDPREAILFLPGRTIRVPRTPAASGARYSDDGVTFWLTGDEVRLEVDGRTFTGCRGTSRLAFRDGAPADSVDFRAAGNEPGWYLEIEEGARILVVVDYGEDRAVFPAPLPTVDPETGRTIYHARAGGRELTVVIEDRPCRDVMSGQPFEATVTATLDGRTYRGCGEAT